MRIDPGRTRADYAAERGLPHYGLVPKDPYANLAFRRAIWERAADDPGFQYEQKCRCKRDLLYFVNTYCLAAGTRVVTADGLVPIEKIDDRHRVWDGHDWVSQGGALCMGRKPVILGYEILLTPDHKVWTIHGWRNASDGYDRAPVRLPDGFTEGRNIPRDSAGSMALPVRLRRRDDGVREFSASRTDAKLRVSAAQADDKNARTFRGCDLFGVDANARPMQESEESCLRPIRRPGHPGLCAVAELRELPCGHGRVSVGDDYRANRQYRGLRARQLHLGGSQSTGPEHSAESHHLDLARRLAAGGVCGEGRHDHRGRSLPPETRHFGGRPVDAGASREAVVYDLINCGPRQAFTILDENDEPLLVHNCVLYEPREPVGPAVFPFITFDFQDDTLLEMERRLGKRDIPIEKSRDMGATFMAVAGCCFRRWLFFQRQSFLLVSRTEDEVDSAEADVGTLFFKLDLQLRYLPSWMVPLHDRRMQHLSNREMANVIDGEAPTRNLARSDRRLMIVMDELGAFSDTNAEGAWASTMRSTNCRMPIGTPGGAHGKFYEMMNPHPGQPAIDKLTLHWRDHPILNQGMYQYRNGQLEILDREYQFPPDYVFVKDGKLRSMLYDRDERERGATPQQMASEWDIEYVGSGFPVWEPERVRNAELRDSRPAMEVGDLVLEDEEEDPQVKRFARSESGALRLWCALGAEGGPPDGDYVIGADISNGVGVTPSVAVVLRKDTREQVGELTCYHHDPKEFASLCVALARWFHRALLSWETNGPGGWFGKRIRGIGYTALWYRRADEENRAAKVIPKAGWHNNPKNRDASIGHFGTAVLEGDVICRSKDIFREMLHYRQTASGFVSGTIPRVAGNDPTAKPENHGDHVIAGLVAHKAIGSQPRVRRPEGERREDDGMPMTSLAYRRGLRDKAAKRQEFATSGWSL